MTAAEVAEKLRLSLSQVYAQVYALVNAGRLRCYRLTTAKQGAIRFSEKQLADFLQLTEEKDALPAGVKHLRF